MPTGTNSGDATTAASELVPSTWLGWASRHKDLLAILFLALLALVPRLYRIGSAPEGLNADELFNAVDALSLGPGSWQIYFEGNFGREALFLYLMAIPLKLFGQEIWALRLPAVILGTGSVLLAYLVGKQAFNRRVGFIAGAVMAVSLWPIMQSRWGLRAVSLTFFTALTVYLFSRVIYQEKTRLFGWIAAGIALGLTMYTYIPARLFPLVIVAWLVWFSILKKDWLRRHWSKILLSFAVAFLVFAPFGIYMIRYPDKVNQRVGGLWDSVSTKVDEDPATVLERAASVPLMFTFSGDTEGRYHVPDRPVFDPLTGLFFYLGVAASLWLAFKKGGDPARRSAYGLMFLWIGAMLAANLVVGANTSFLRGAGAIIPIYLLTGIGIDFLFASLRHRWPERARLWNWSLVGLVGIGLLATLALSWQTYFSTWLNLPDARDAWHADLGLAGRYLSDNPPGPGEQLFFAYDYVLDATPQVFKYNSENAVFWFENQNSFAWRPGAAESTYITSASRPVNSAVIDRLANLSDAERVDFSNGDPALNIYRIDPSQIEWEPAVPFGKEFYDGPRLLGFDIPDETFRGDSISLTTHWEVPADREGLPNRLAFIQVRLRDAGGNVWSQAESLLGYPQSGWKEGDRFIQSLELEIPRGMPPGPAFFSFGMRDWDGTEYTVQEISPDGEETSAEPAGPLIVRSRPAEEITIDESAPVFDGRLALLDSRFSTLVAPGLPLDLSLDWLALVDLEVDYEVQIQLFSPGSNNPVLEQRFTLWPESYPPSEWGAGEQVTTFHRFDIPLEVETIEDPALRIQLFEPGMTEPAAVDQGDDILADLTWSLRDHVFETPEIENPLNASFGDSIELLGYALDATGSHPGGEVLLTLYWRAVHTPEKAYTVFNHLVGPDGQFQGQFDSPPVGDAWMTSTWQPGEVITDQRVIPIRADAPGGLVKIIIGLYTADGVERLPIFLDGVEQPGDQLELVEILIDR
jgi:4-amino-4-deoxy-L-arabinose transferase-like glycosyltransferase